MFTGIVEALGRVVEVGELRGGRELGVEATGIAADLARGESVAVNGVCQTVTAVKDGRFRFYAMGETLRASTLGELKRGDAVNLERALTPGDRLGGHFVSGHIDGQGTLVERNDEGDWSTFWFELPQELSRQMASKGSIAIDGVSLTIVESLPRRFSVALIPFTLDVTTLGKLKVGDKVNLETDILAKYVERLDEAREWDDGQGPVEQ